MRISLEMVVFKIGGNAVGFKIGGKERLWFLIGKSIR